MKNSLRFFFICISAACFPSILSAQNGACVPSIGFDCVTTPAYIDSVIATNAVTNFSNNGTDCNAQAQNYADYPNRIVEETTGGIFNLHIGLNHSAPVFLSAWIDWNDNLVFGSGEQIYMSSTPVVMANITVYVPLTAIIDTLIIRVRCGSTSMGPCDSVGAGETEDYRLIVLLPAGINSSSDYSTWNISPNPANDVLSIEMANETAEVTVFDVAGQQVAKTVVADGRASIDVSDLPRGMYFVRVSGKAGVKKFVH